MRALLLALVLFATPAFADPRIVYERPDGEVSVVIPMPNARLAAAYDGETFDPPIPAYHLFTAMPLPGGVEWAETEAEFVARIRSEIVPPEAANVRVMDHTALPPRTFRNAWELAGAEIRVNMARAREIQAERIERARVAELRRLRDEELIDGVDRSDRMQEVRNATVDLGAARTPEQLDAMWPDALPRQ